MGLIQVTLMKCPHSFTAPHDDWLKAQIAAGKYASDSEIVRDLIRRQQEREDKFHALKAAIQEGLDSGISDKTVPQIMQDVEARLRDNVLEDIPVLGLLPTRWRFSVIIKGEIG